MGEILLIPGPTFLHQSVRTAMGGEAISHVSPEFKEAFLDILDLTKKVFMSKDGQPIVFTGSGTVGMEAVVTSLLEPGDRVLVAETGYFGKRFTLLAKLHGANVDVLEFEEGSPADPEAIRQQLSRHSYKALLVTHIETSNGVMNDIPRLSRIARDNNVLMIVDSVCGVGGARFLFDDWDIDVAITASQKALAGPPGAALICLSGRAQEALEARKTPIPSYYFDLKRWIGVMKDPSIYLSTPATHVMLGLRQALHLVLKEGLETRWRRHEVLAKGLEMGVEALGLEIVAREGCRSPTVTAIRVPKGHAAQIQQVMRRSYQVHIARGIGHDSDTVIRIGHFGNVGHTEITAALTSLALSLTQLGSPRDPAEAIKAAAPYLEQAPPAPA